MYTPRTEVREIQERHIIKMIIFTLNLDYNYRGRHCVIAMTKNFLDDYYFPQGDDGAGKKRRERR